MSHAMTNERLRSLFNRYISKTITDDERREFFEFISNPVYDEYVKELMNELWHSIPEENFHVALPKDAFEKIVQNDSPADQRGFYKSVWMKIAAGISFLAIATCFYLYSLSFDDQSIAEVKPVPEERVSSFVRLPDGSTVVLNERSNLRYSDSFATGSTREVYLEGEAFFNIAHQASRPFIVHSGQVSTTVLGTAFNVRAFPADQAVIVTVTRGRVEVSANKNVLAVITRDQQITVNKNSASISQDSQNNRAAISWMEQDLFFDDVTMEEAVEELQNRFDVQIVLLKNEIKKCRFTATFIKGEDLEQILLVICEFNKASFQKNNSGNLIEIDGAGCQ
jgi:transmembrane sensor